MLVSKTAPPNDLWPNSLLHFDHGPSRTEATPIEKTEKSTNQIRSTSSRCRWVKTIFYVGSIALASSFNGFTDSGNFEFLVKIIFYEVDATIAANANITAAYSEKGGCGKRCPYTVASC